MRTFVCGLLGSVMLAGSAQATLWQWNNIVLDGLQEVPPNATPGSGIGMATLDDVTGLMNISGSYADLIGTATLAHLHAPAAPGASAGPIITLSHTGGTSGTFSGSGTLDTTQMGWVLGGLSYINVHSTFDSGGEIRGQLLDPVPEPATVALLASGWISALWFRRKLRRPR